MAFTIVQAGDTLVGLDEQGNQATLTLPAGVTIDANQRLRSTVFGNFAILVNSPSRPLTVDANLAVRVLTPDAPTVAPTAAAGAAGALTGAYKAKQTFRIYAADGTLIAESDYGPDSNSVTLAAQKLSLSGLNLSHDAVSATELYRTTAGTDTFFKWAQIDGNIQTTFSDDLSDAAMDAFSAPSLGSAPDLYLIAEFRNRLFGASKAAKDYLRYTEVGAQYAWPSDNQQPIARLGSDDQGLKALMRRRDALGIARSNGIYQFTGTSDENFRIVNVSENCGVIATDSVAVFRDAAYFLWNDGVYKWDSNGIDCVSDGKVRRWFAENSTFNLSRLQYAFAHIDPLQFRYRLFLASADSNVENCWIEYDFRSDKWWGPHTSHAFNPSAAFLGTTSSGLFIPMIGGKDGFTRRERKRRFDDVYTPIDYDVVTSKIDNNNPNEEKYYGQLYLSQIPQESGTLHVQSTVGFVDELRRRFNPQRAPDATHDYEVPLDIDRVTVGRIGVGKAAKVRFRNNEPDVNVGLRGFEIDPVNTIGPR